MNPSAQFAQKDQDKLLSAMRAYPFATLINQQVEPAKDVQSSVSDDPPSAELIVNYLPLLVDTSKPNYIVLKGHIAKANDLWKISSPNTTVVFNGPNAYISPSAYPSKKVNGRVAPTWNYVVVKAKGRIEFKNEATWKMSFLNDLSNEHESESDNPWTVADAPIDYTQKLLPAIVGFEIIVKELQGTWKISQNQTPENYAGVVDYLSELTHSNAQALVELMKA